MSLFKKKVRKESCPNARNDAYEFDNHLFDKWSEPFEQPMFTILRGGRQIERIEHMQRRKCLYCGLIEERVL